MITQLVSIITPTFNSRKFIGETYQSLLMQSHQHWEWIVVDDFSSDGTRDWLLEKAEMDSRIVVLFNDSNQGAGLSRNKAIGEAKGRYIAFVDADDMWKENKLETQLKFMTENDLDLCYSSYDVINVESDLLSTRIAPATVSYRSLLKCNEIGCLTAIFDTTRLGKVFMPKLRKRQDLALWLMLLKLGAKAGGVVDSLACYRVGVSSLSSNKYKVLPYQWAVYRQCEKLSYIKSCYYFTAYAWNGLYRYYR